MKYKVGDILKPKKGHEDDCCNYSNFSGHYIQITKVARNRYRYGIYYNNECVHDCFSCLNDDNLELVTPIIKNSKPPMKFKVGDVVKIKSDSRYAEQNDSIGDGEIKSIEKGWILYYSITFSNGYKNSYNSQDLELVTTKEVSSSSFTEEQREEIIKIIKTFK